MTEDREPQMMQARDANAKAVIAVASTNELMLEGYRCIYCHKLTPAHIWWRVDHGPNCPGPTEMVVINEPKS